MFMMNISIQKYLSGFPYAKMCTVADGEMLAESISNPKKANPESVKDFDWDGIAQQMEDVYREVTG